jgi:2-isopropylmalate synthase
MSESEVDISNMDTHEIEIFDTTLRDGTQREGISLSAADKLRIAERLDSLGVTFIEGGWPGSNPKDAEFFARAQTRRFSHAELVAFGATRRPSLRAADDPSLQALVAAGTNVCALFGKSWVLHVERVLKTDCAENLKMIEESVRMLRDAGKRVIYDAEHFFDGWRADGDYALETLRAAARGGAETLVLCDTNGGSLPWQIAEGVRAAMTVGAPLGIHAHDDAGCAVANTLEAVRVGARHVQGTINGYGERCGNANLCIVIPDLELKLNLRCLPDGKLASLTELARYVGELAGVLPRADMPFVGQSAFAHKGGVHVAAMRAARGSYEHVEPAAVGNRSRVLVSELGGRAALIAKAEEHAVPLDDADAAPLMGRIKEREKLGFAFESAEASTVLLMRRHRAGYTPPFRLVGYRVTIGQNGDGAPFSDATLMLDIKGTVLHTSARAEGPVAALDQALRSALLPAFPEVQNVRLCDYHVHIVDGRDGTAAVTRVLIDSSDGTRSWRTLGASGNIIDASWQALADGIEFGLTPQTLAETTTPSAEQSREAAS